MNFFQTKKPKPQRSPITEALAQVDKAVDELVLIDWDAVKKVVDDPLSDPTIMEMTKLSPEAVTTIIKMLAVTKSYQDQLTKIVSNGISDEDMDELIRRSKEIL